MSTLDDNISQSLKYAPTFHLKPEVSQRDIIDISQVDQLHGLDRLKDQITEGVFKASSGVRQIPIEVMYQGDGADLFDAYSSNPAYYLYQAERSILQTYANEIATLIADQSKIIDLGAGSLKKTQVLLTAVAQAHHICHNVDYYALDINREALVESLAQLPELKKISYHGLFGTYKSGLHHVSKMQKQRDVDQAPYLFMWLGASIANLTMNDTIDMINSIAEVMLDGDLILVGIDGWTSDEIFNAAYNPADKLVLNTLMNANEILGQDVFDMSKFVYSSQFNRLVGRNECCCMASEAIELKYDGEIARLEQGERILVVPSYKYTDEQVINIVKDNGCLEVIRRFEAPDSANNQYGVWIWRKVARQ
jgi:EasF-like predicted methyltransferase